jgi:error-prone DNA polymerase
MHGTTAPRQRSAMTRLLSTGNQRGKKGECLLDYADLLANDEGQIILAVPTDRLDATFCKNLHRIAEDFRGSEYLAASRRYRSDDAR